MAGFRTFATGEVLTAANVNNFLMKQSVMVFADADARTAALGAEVTEGMLTFNKDTGALEVFDGADFVEAGGGGGFDTVTEITATDATFSVPTLDTPIVRVTVIGGGGGGGGNEANGGDGGSTIFGVGAAFETVALGGQGGVPGGRTGRSNAVGRLGFVSGNGGRPTAQSINNSGSTGSIGIGGEVITKYIDLTGVATISITIGAGGSGEGGRGVVIIEFRAA